MTLHTVKQIHGFTKRTLLKVTMGVAIDPTGKAGWPYVANTVTRACTNLGAARLNKELYSLQHNMNTISSAGRGGMGGCIVKPSVHQ